MARVMEIDTPLGADVLLFRAMSAHEELGRPFEYLIEVLSEQGDVAPADLLGKNVTVKLEVPSGDTRHFDGVVVRLATASPLGRYHRYQLTVRPWLWLLTRNSDCRIFQNLTVPEILTKVFEAYPSAAVDNQLTGTYRSWEYCVQYRETDFNFVSRLMEQEGIYYYFKHEAGKHTLVLADGLSAHASLPGLESVPFIPHDRGGRLEQEYVDEWSMSAEIQPGAYTLDDFDFTRPSSELRTTTRRERPHAESEREYYDYPGEYEKTSDGEHYAKMRLEELQARHEQIQGGGNARALAAGGLVRLTGHPRNDQNREYLVLATHVEMQFGEYESLDAGGTDYRVRFSVLHSQEPFRTQRLTAKPAVQGPQTAIVVGPSGDEIYTDKYGRVKVQFHWDRLGEQDENSSCWVRVSQPWAGKNFGMIAIPRIGQEVVVDFLEGDPDRPMITGRVYNAEQMPPWELPGNMTRTGIVTRSSKGGSASNANELRFEDKKGEEEVFLHAERNLRTTVEVDELRDVGNDRTTDIHGIDRLTVDKSRYEHVKGDFRDLLVDNLSTRRIGGGEIEEITDGLKTTIKTGGHEHTVNAGGQNITITGGITETVTGNVSQTINGGNHSQTISSGSSAATASLGFTFTTPMTYVVNAATSMTINTPLLNIIGGASVTAATPQESNVKGTEFATVGMKGEMVGVAMSTTGVNIEQKQLEMAATTCKVEVVNLDVENETLKSITAALHLANPATQIVMGALALAKTGIKIVG